MSKTHFTDRDYTIKYLAEALHESRLAVLLGAGVSRELVNTGTGAIGLPAWPNLIDRLYKSQSGWLLPAGSNYPQQAEDFRNLFLSAGKTEKEFYALVQDVLYDGVSLDFAVIRQNATLAGIGALVAHSRRGKVNEVFTFNFDDILERYLLYHGVVAKPVIEEKFWARAADVLVHHPHGFLPSKGSPFTELSSFLVFDEYSYAKQHSDSRWNQRMEVAMQAHVCLFVGLSRDDSHLKQLVARTHEKHAFSQAKDGYWGIVLRAKPTQEEVLEWSRYDVHVEPLTDYPTDLPRFLFDVCQRAAQMTI